MEKRRTLKRRKGITLVLLTLVCCLMFILCFGGMSTAKADSGNNDASSDVVTGYYLDIPCAGIVGDISPLDKQFLNYRNVMLAFSRNTAKVTVIFTMINIKDNGNPLIVTTSVDVNFPASVWASTSVNIVNSVKVNIRKTYYDILVSGDFSKISLTILISGRGIPIADKVPFPNGYYSSLTGCKVYTGPDDGSLGDNGGVEEKPSIKSWFEHGFDWLANTFGWTFSYSTFKKSCIITVAAIGVLLVVSFIYKLFKK